VADGLWWRVCSAMGCGLAFINPALAVDNADSGASNTAFTGYLKSYALWQDAVDPILPEQGQSQNSLRLMLDYFPSASLALQLHYEVQPIYRSNPAADLAAGSAFSTLSSIDNRYRIDDLHNDYGDGDEHWIWLQNLDRFNLRYSTDHGDLTIGRQVVSLGSARFVNPTDIFVPFGLQTLNQEYRVGIDAVRYQAALGDFRQLDLGWVIGADGKRENSALFVRGRDNWKGMDLQAVTIALDQAWLLGGGLETALGDFGFWFETAYVHARLDDQITSPLTSPPDSSASIHYWRHSIGSDYALNERWILMLEYHFNGAGASDPADYTALLQRQPYQQAGVYLLGRHYLIPALSWQATPLLKVTGSGFFNLQDDSCFISLAGEFSWSENLYSDVGLYWSQGDGLQVANNPAGLQFGSEFGIYPVSLYASLRWYF